MIIINSREQTVTLLILSIKKGLTERVGHLRSKGLKMKWERRMKVKESGGWWRVEWGCLKHKCRSGL